MPWFPRALRRAAASAVVAISLAAAAPAALAVPTAVLKRAAAPAAAPAATPVIDDAAVARAIDARLKGSEGLDNVRATVSGGVVRLEGTVLKPALVDKAAQLATAEPGVTRVDNGIELAAGVRDRVDGVFDATREKLTALAGKLPLIVVAMALVLLASWLGRVVSNRLHVKRLNHRKNPYFDALVRRAVHLGIVIAGVLLALELLDWTTAVSAIVGSAGVLGLVVGFAFKDIAENYIAGILLSLRRPFAPGDHIRIDAHEGKVVALTARATVLMTLDGNRLSLPNGLVFKSVLLNFSENPRRRFEFDVTIDPGESIGDAQARALAAMATVDGVLADPAPSSLVHAFTPAGSVLRFYGWIDQTVNDLGKVRTEALRAVKGDFAEAGVEAPRSVQYVVLQRPATAASTAAAVQGEQAGGDTSVNHDIDVQMARAQDKHSDNNML